MGYIGAALAIILDRVGISALAFSLGMFIPLQLNLPLIAGGYVNYLVTHSSKDPELNNRRGERGTLLASGFIAGGALMGVVSAGLTFAGVDLTLGDKWVGSPASVTLSLVVYLLLVAYLLFATKKSK